MQSIKIKHNVEMGHRLSMQPDSKCFHLHGHSWWVEVEIEGAVRADGMIIDFADVKKQVRSFLDRNFDHHLCLNDQDPLVRSLTTTELVAWGIQRVSFDPTVENMAQYWGRAIMGMFGSEYLYTITVWEASTNAATWSNR